jgi:hypothetical protein
LSSTPPSILIVGTIDRPDIISILSGLRQHAKLTFLEYAFNWGTPTNPKNFEGYGPVRYWSEFRSARALLDELRPDKIVFFYINSLNQVALNVAASARPGVRRYHLEHGHRQRYEEAVAASGSHWTTEKATRFDPAKWRRECRHILGNHGFFLGTLLALDGPRRRDLARFGRRIYLDGPSPQLLMEFAHLRRPDHYVSFSPEVFEFHRVQDAVPPEDLARVCYVGLPQFDHFAALAPQDVDPRNVLLIDTVLHHLHVYGWNDEFRAAWVRAIFEIIRELGLKLFVKPHPGDVSSAWRPYLGSGAVEIVDLAGLTRLIPRAGTVIGAYSTLQVPLAAMPHVALITLEIHPEPGHCGSKQFVDAKVAAPATTFQELRDLLARRDELRVEQARAKPAFVTQFLHRFDGQAGIRLREAILDG